jgi:dephospho-CoA kinase
MLHVGLTGGYASGKTLVARELERLGCHLIYADELGHRVLLADGEAYRPVVQSFGRDILAADGSIDRKKLALIVFENPELLGTLSGFVHPAVFRLERQMLDAFAAQDPNGIAVVEAAILIETERYKDFDRMILTACDIETQVARGVKRDHLTREQVLARLEKQLPLEEKKKHAHYIVDTSGSKADTVRQVAAVFNDLKQLAQGRNA